MSEWQPIETAPHGKIILAECQDGDTTYLCSVVYWTAEALAKEFGGGRHGPDEYEDCWSRSSYDEYVEPIRWLKGFEVPDSLKIMM